MSLANMLTQSLTIKKFASGTDEYGNTVTTNAGTTSTVLGYLELTESVETLNDRDTVVSGYQAWLPADASVNAFDRVIFNGSTFEVDGTPWTVYNPRTGQTSHLVAKLKVVA